MVDAPQIGESSMCFSGILMSSSTSGGSEFLSSEDRGAVHLAVSDCFVHGTDELKELVKVSLQQTGVLSSIKAQLRVYPADSCGSTLTGRLQAAVFKVVNDEQSLKASNPPPAVMNTSEGALAADLVREFLEFYKLHSSLAVLIPEAGLDQDYPGRHPLAARLGVPDDPGCPLLVRLLSAHTSNPGAPQTQKTPAPTTKPGSGPPAAAPSMPEEEEPEAEEEATPPPTQAESRAARNEGSRLG
eukprot:2316354-Rhodomonas_salina.1